MKTQKLIILVFLLGIGLSDVITMTSDDQATNLGAAYTSPSQTPQDPDVQIYTV